MVKVEGNEKHIKYVKTRKFGEKQREFLKVGGKNNFSRVRGECIEIAKIGGKF